MIEMALVVSLIGILAMVAWPRMSSAREGAKLQGAKRQVITQLLAARASAIQRGRQVQLRTSGNEVWATAPVGGVQTEITPRAKLYETFAVTVTASHDPITFDQRGYATSLPLTGGVFVLDLGGVVDSVCVTRLGTVARECGL